LIDDEPTNEKLNITSFEVATVSELMHAFEKRRLRTL